MADEPEQSPSFERCAPVVPEGPVRIEKPDRVRLLRFAGVVFRVVLLPVIVAVVKRAAVAGTRLTKARRPDLWAARNGEKPPRKGPSDG